MIKKFRKFLSFYKEADTIYNIHSPVVFEFLLDVFDTKKEFYIFKQIKKERKFLLNNKSVINITDLGAGSQTNASTKRSISNIANQVVSNERKCRMLFNLVNKYQPVTTIELGTSLGISTLYLSYACASGTIYTIEGDSAIFDMANRIFHKRHIHNIKNYNASFDEALPQILNETGSFDLAYIDGNHSYDATMKYFNLLLQKKHEKSIMVFDDIYWSDGMTKAWEEILNNQAVKYSINTFDLGFVFFEDIMPRQHFKIIDYWKKPFRIGLWG